MGRVLARPGPDERGRDERQRRDPEERVAQRHGECESAPDHRAHDRTGGGRGLERTRHAPLLRGRGGNGHERHARRDVAREHALQDAQDQQLPRRRGERHRADEDGDREHRAQHHDPPAVAIPECAPQGTHQRRRQRSCSVQHAGPGRDLVAVLHPELLEQRGEERQEAHHPDRSDQVGGPDRPVRALPSLHEAAEDSVFATRSDCRRHARRVGHAGRVRTSCELSGGLSRRESRIDDTVVERLAKDATASGSKCDPARETIHSTASA